MKPQFFNDQLKITPVAASEGEGRFEKELFIHKKLELLLLSKGF